MGLSSDVKWRTQCDQFLWVDRKRKWVNESMSNSFLLCTTFYPFILWAGWMFMWRSWDNFRSLGFLLPLSYVSRGSKLCCQTWHQAPLPIMASSPPKIKPLTQGLEHIRQSESVNYCYFYFVTMLNFLVYCFKQPVCPLSLSPKDLYYHCASEDETQGCVHAMQMFYHSYIQNDLMVFERS